MISKINKSNTWKYILCVTSALAVSCAVIIPTMYYCSPKTTQSVGAPTYTLSFGGSNHELSSIVDGDSNNIVTINAHFSTPVWRASLSVVDEDAQEDLAGDYISYSVDNGATWTILDGYIWQIIIWDHGKKSDGSIMFKLEKYLPSIKVANFYLDYSLNDGDEPLNTGTYIPLLFSRPISTETSESIQSIDFQLYNGGNYGVQNPLDTTIGRTSSYTSDDAFFSDLKAKLGDNFSSNNVLTPPTNQEQFCNVLNKDISSDGISNAASIAALIAMENYYLIKSYCSMYSTYTQRCSYNYDLKISYLLKQNSSSTFSFAITQLYTSNSQRTTVANTGIGDPTDGYNKGYSYSISYLPNYFYLAANKSIMFTSSTAQNINNLFISVNNVYRNDDGSSVGSPSNRDISLKSIPKSAIAEIYPGVTNWPSWTFPA